jgi:hypothetical protein
MVINLFLLPEVLTLATTFALQMRIVPIILRNLSGFSFAKLPDHLPLGVNPTDPLELLYVFDVPHSRFRHLGQEAPQFVFSVCQSL